MIIIETFELSTRAERSPAALGAAVAANAIAAAEIQGSQESPRRLRTYIVGLLRAKCQCYSQQVLSLLLRWFREYLFPPPIVELAAFQRTRLSIALVLMATLAAAPTHGDEQSGVASIFCDKVTATGGMDCNALVAASPGLPLGTMVTVVHNGHSEIVKIIDRGPAVWTHRVIDLSTGAGRGISLDGLGAVTLSWDADVIIPLPLYVAPTVVPLVAPVVLVAFHPYHQRPRIREIGARARISPSSYMRKHPRSNSRRR